MWYCVFMFFNNIGECRPKIPTKFLPNYPIALLSIHHIRVRHNTLLFVLEFERRKDDEKNKNDDDFDGDHHDRRPPSKKKPPALSSHE